MSDNEKAATYIGWKDALCPEPLGFHPSKGCLNILAHLHRKEHKRPAPDMTDPRNYMRALEAVRAKGYVWDVGACPNWQREIMRKHRAPLPCDERLHTVAIWGMGYEQLVNEIYGDSDDGKAGTAVVKALAALYDAENQR